MSRYVASRHVEDAKTHLTELLRKHKRMLPLIGIYLVVENIKAEEYHNAAAVLDRTISAEQHKHQGKDEWLMSHLRSARESLQKAITELQANAKAKGD